jgi:hypothetical protein
VKLEEFKSLTKNILENLSDQAKVSELLMQLNDDYGQQLASHSELSTKVTEQEGKMKSLQETNMNLFLKVANPVPQTVIETPVNEKVSYDDLLSNWNK